MITKTDIERIAQALGKGGRIRSRGINGQTEEWDIYPTAFFVKVVSHVADAIADNNPRFNRAKFYDRVKEYAERYE